MFIIEEEKLKKLLVLLLISLFAISVQAQTPHSVKINASSAYPVFLFRANCSTALVGGLCPSGSEGAFSRINSTASPLPVTDSTVVANTVYSYYLTAYCAGCSPSESLPSAHIGASVPADGQPPPPTGLSIVSIAMNTVGSTTTLAASFVAPFGDTVTWNIKNAAGRIVKSGTTTGGVGVYCIHPTFYNLTYTPLLTVCDNGQCVSKSAM